MSGLKAILLQKRLQRARNSFRDFVLQMMPEYIMAPHHELMIEKIQEHVERPNGRLNISMPPRHGKSQLCSIFLPAWVLGNDPSTEIIHTSYAAELSNAFSRQVRSLVRDDLQYRQIFPTLILDPDRSRLNDWRVVGGGGFRSLGVGGGVTGHGADLLIIDDPHKEGDAASLLTLDNVYTWYATAARTRLSPGASIIFLMTRWHPLDLAGRLLDAEGGDQWESIVLPALAGENDPLGRSEGEALWPERFSREELLKLKALDDSYFQALYQNNPLGSDEVMFLDAFIPGKLPFWHEGDSGVRKFWTFDLATSAKETADYSVMARWAWRSGIFYLRDVVRIREAFPAVRARIVDIYHRYPDHRLVFPKEVLELLMLKELRHDLGASSRFAEVPLNGDKIQKAGLFAHLVNNKRFVVNPDCPVCKYWISEVLLFPHARFDDCVDTASVATHYIGIQNTFSISVIK